MSLVESGGCRVVGTSSFKWSDVLSYGGYESWDDSQEAQITRLFNEASAQLTLLEETDQPTSERWHFDPLKLADLLNRSGEALRNESAAKVVPEQNQTDLQSLVSRAITRYSDEGSELVKLYGKAIDRELHTKAKIEQAVYRSKSTTVTNLNKLNEKLASRSAKALEITHKKLKVNHLVAETMHSLNQMKVEFVHSLNILRIALIAHPLYRENGGEIYSSFMDSENRVGELVDTVHNDIKSKLNRKYVSDQYESDEDSDINVSDDSGSEVEVDDEDFDSDSDDVVGSGDESKRTPCMNLLDIG